MFESDLSNLNDKSSYILIPDFIHDQYLAGEIYGQFAAVTLFMDISGFTAMAQSFLHYDKEGTEELATIINAIFEPIILAIYQRGGFVTGFAGDAITIVFPTVEKQTILRACDTALSIRKIFANQAGYETSIGRVVLGVKQGLSAGNVEWGVLGPNDHKTYYFRGDAIDRSAQAEQQAQMGEIVLTNHLAETLAVLAPDEADFVSSHDDYALLTGLHSIISLVDQDRPTSQFSEPICYQFFRPELWYHSRQGEFRQAGIVFLAFPPDISQAKLSQLVQSAIKQADLFGGHFIEVDFGDKGGVILVCFGAPRTHENDIERSLSFSLALSDQLSKLDIDWRMGITYGPVYAGMVGIRLRCKYAVMGNVVNLSARLMAKASTHQILVTGAVVDQPGFKFAPVGKYAYKGFVGALQTYQLLGTENHQNEQLPKDDLPLFVGREVERQRLLDFMQPLFENKSPGAVIVYGEPGIGKSLLVADLRNRLSNPIHWLVGPADQTLRQAFNPFVACLKKRFSQASDATEMENKAAFFSQWQGLKGELDTCDAPLTLINELERTHTFIGALLDLYWAGSLYDQLDGQLRYENTITAIKTWLFAESYLKPIVLVLEDGHWFDPASQELLTSISKEMVNYRLMITVTSRYLDNGIRPEFNLSSEASQMVIELGALTKSSLRQQAQQIVKIPLSDSLFELLETRSQGNPFFAQQLLYYFQENDLLAEDDENKAVFSRDQITLPTSINAILIARIDRLLQKAKEVVQTAAVLGAEFDVEILAQMLQADISQEIREAETNQIWQTFNKLRYIFKHVMLRDAAYDMQLRQQLRRLHVLAASAYEKLHSKNLAPYFATLAYHYRIAEELDQEKTYARLAGEYASQKGNQNEAVTYFSRAIELAPKTELYELLLLREDCRHILGDRENQGLDIIELTSIVFDVAQSRSPVKSSSMKFESLEPVQRQIEVILRHVRYRSGISDYPATVIAAKRGLELSKSIAAIISEIYSRYWWGEALQQQGKYEEANLQFHLGLKQLKGVNNPNLKARLLKGQGWIAFRQGNALLAMEKLGEALQIAQLKGNQREEMTILKSLGGAANARGDYMAARTWQLQGLEVARSIGYQQEEGSLLNNLGNTSRFLGDYDAAVSYHKRAIVLCKNTGWRMGETVGYVNLGLALYNLGEYEAAFENTQKGLKSSQAINTRMIEGVAWYILGNIAADTEKWWDAEHAYRQSIKINELIQLPHYKVEAQAGLVRAYMAQQKFDQLAAPLKEILNYLNGGGSVRSVEEPIRVYLTCYEALQALDDPQAENMLNAASNLLGTQIARLPDHDARKLFIENVPFHQAVVKASRGY